MANSQKLQEFLAAEVPNFIRGSIEQYFDDNLLLSRLKAAGGVKRNGEGTQLEWRARLTRHSNIHQRRAVGAFSNRTFPTEKIHEIATLPWVKADSSIAISEDDIKLNRGQKSRIMDLVDTQLRTLVEDAMDAFDADLYSSGATANQISGLQSFMLATASTGSYAGISRVTFTAWRNQSVLHTNYSSSFATRGIEMIRAGNNAVAAIGKKPPPLTIVNYTDWLRLSKAVYDKQTYYHVNSESFKEGVPNIYVDGTQVYPAQNCPAQMGFGLTLNEIALVLVPSLAKTRDVFDLIVHDDPVYKDATLIALKVLGQMMCRVPKLQVRYTMEP